MTVEELIKHLSKLPQDSLVVMSSDGEGNKYAPLSDIGQYKYVPEWNELLPTDEEDPIDEHQHKVITAVVFWPV
jgi:hypothetical protein